MSKQPHNRMSKLESRSTEAGALAPVFEKSTTNTKPNLLRRKRTVNIVTFNVTTINRINLVLQRLQRAEYSNHIRTGIEIV